MTNRDLPIMQTLPANINKLAREIWQGDLEELKTPCFIIDENLLCKNMQCLARYNQLPYVKVLLAQKAFSNYAVYPLFSEYLSGTTSSGLNEALLAQEYFVGEIHVFSPAFSDNDFKRLLAISDHIVFNSWSQWLSKQALIKTFVLNHPEAKIPHFSLRINPEVSTSDHGIYDPCSFGSRLGVTLENFEYGLKNSWLKPEGIFRTWTEEASAEAKSASESSAKEFCPEIDGLHFHCLCEQNSDDLLVLWEGIKEKFGPYLKHFKYLNMGGGHHITRSDYNHELLTRILEEARELLAPEAIIYLEPGEACALNAGFLLTKIEDVVNNKIDTALMDMSPTCHTPDVLEMPYRPKLAALLREYDLRQYLDLARLYPQDLLQNKLVDPQTLLGLREKYYEASQKKLYLANDEESAETFAYRLAGPSCLAGDFMDTYYFHTPLFPGDYLLFYDMAIYSMVKTNTFNGINLPNIYIISQDKTEAVLWKSFSYEDFKNRL